MYSDLKQKETLQASLSIQNLKSPIFFFADLEKEEYVNIFPGLNQIPLSYDFRRLSLPDNNKLCKPYHILVLMSILP